jgi:tryptophan synthase alpha chain
MSRIANIFGTLRATGAKGLMPFVCGGYPGPGVLPRVVAELNRAGASIVEIGFPFSDPIADGPVIAAAMHEALLKGATPESVFAEVRAGRETVGGELGLVGMISVSLVWRIGIGRLIAQAQQSGMDGFIFPDLPGDEGPELIAAVRDAGLTTSLLVAPTTSPARVEKIVRDCSGFIYLLARAGITGESSEAPDVAANVRRLRGLTDLPIACGFGISTAEHVRAVVAHADAAIVGSALVRCMSEAVRAGRDPAQAAGGLVAELATGLT